MTPHVVADVGNSRLKWGRCSPDAVTDMAALSPEDDAAWQAQFDGWRLAPGNLWVIAGVHPRRRAGLADWLLRRGQQVRVLTQARDLPLQTLLEEPEKAGIDRLLNAVAGNRRREPGYGAMLVDAGSAVTADWLNETGAFAGGVILPGFRLMAQALHDYTALLPAIEPPHTLPAVPATATIPAMEAGIFWSVAGAIQAMLRAYQKQARQPIHLYLTGGDAVLVKRVLRTAILWPEMTLEGLRLTAETLS